MRRSQTHSHLRLEVLHDIQEPVVHIWPVLVLVTKLDRVEVAVGVGDVEWSPSL